MPITADDLKEALAPIAAIVKAEREERVEVDLGKIALALVEEAAAVADGEGDLEEKIQGLAKRLGDIEEFLGGVSEDEGKTYADVSEIAKEFSVEAETDKAYAPGHGKGPKGRRKKEKEEVDDEVSKAASMYQARWGGEGRHTVVLATADKVVATFDSCLEAEREALRMNMAELAKLEKEKKVPGEDEEADEGSEAGDGETPPAEPPADGEGGETEEGETETEKKDEDLSDEIAWETDLAPSSPPTTKPERLTKGERPMSARRGERSRMQKWNDARERAMGRRGGASRSMT